MKEIINKPAKAGKIQVAKAVFWAFIGIRKHEDHAADVESLTMKQVVIGGIIGAALFVGVLLLIVNLITN
ncbi:MAG: DUF2970 domain-containing protein [Nitrosomonadaceae bacterium]|nr:DUF2970 domain-containing protein [Nitrosomonadaceae bacterium]